jgi:preprotein translocase subunit SecA
MSWKRRLERWRGSCPVDDDLTPYGETLDKVTSAGKGMAEKSDADLRQAAGTLLTRARSGTPLDDLLVDVFALAREIAERLLGMRPFDVQVMAGVVLHRRNLVEMQTGEGKTLAAVLPAALNALTGRGVHILTFNDYLARRDAAWMGPVYEAMGLSVGIIQEGMSTADRQAAYGADITYATAKEAGFDFLRMHLACRPSEVVHRPFNYVIVDEADSILIDEARVPLVIAGERETSEADPYRIARVVAGLREGADWGTDEHGRSVFLTEGGLDRVEHELGCGDLHEPANYLLLTEVNQALHARALLRRDVDYIVRSDRIELVDEFTGRMVDDRRWPDGLQAALEAKEGLPIRPGGHILGSVTLQHFLMHYPRLSGMTATALPASVELSDVYGLTTVPILPNRPCIRRDLPDVIFTDKEAKYGALVAEITDTNRSGRPVLVGTCSVEESELLAGRLRQAGVACQVLNAKNDEAEAAIIAQAGAARAVTISTNMAGRGTDIRLGGAEGVERDRIVNLGGLYVIGTNRHESRRIDDQLRGRAGRQGDPGLSRFFVSLEDDLMVRYGIETLIPAKLRPKPQKEPVAHPVIRREVDRLQRIVEGQNRDIRKTLWRYSQLVERQRKTLQDWRMAVLSDPACLVVFAERLPERHRHLCGLLGKQAVEQAERAIMLHHIDECWADHLAFIAHVREGIHLADIGGLDPLEEFHKQVAEAFRMLHATIEARAAATLEAVEMINGRIDLAGAGVRGPSSTWTYLVNDRVLSDLQQMLSGPHSLAFSAVAWLTTWPVLAWWTLREWLGRARE